MAKAKKKAQLRYFKQEDGREGYAINIYTEYGWSLDTWYPLVVREGGNGETDFVHWSILQKLAHLQDIGYEIDLRF